MVCVGGLNSADPSPALVRKIEMEEKSLQGAASLTLKMEEETRGQEAGDSFPPAGTPHSPSSRGGHGGPKAACGWGFGLRGPREEASLTPAPQDPASAQMALGPV